MLETYKGTDLEYKEYEPLYPFVTPKEEEENELIQTQKESGKRRYQRNLPLQKQNEAREERKSTPIDRSFRLHISLWGLFLVLIGYIIHFVVRDSQNVITDSHNLRLQELEKYVVRGKIISANGKVLAQTVSDVMAMAIAR